MSQSLGQALGQSEAFGKGSLLAVEQPLVSGVPAFVVRISSWLSEAVVDAGFTIRGGPTFGPLQKPDLVHFPLGILATQMAIVLNHLGIGMS